MHKTFRDLSEEISGPTNSTKARQNNSTKTRPPAREFTKKCFDNFALVVF